VTLYRAQHDYHWMARAIQLARRGCYSAAPRPLAGCILIRKQQEVGQGVHLASNGPDALREALANAGSQSFGATAYLTLTPAKMWCACPVDALIESGVRRLVLAGEGGNWREPAARLQAAGIAVDCGMLADEARQLNEVWYHRLQSGRPYITVKLAMTLDGRTALANGLSQWITGPQSRADVHRQRARAGAILSGADTVIADNAALNVRWPEDGPPYPLAAIRQPLRVVVDSQQRLSAGLKLFSIRSPILLAHVQPSVRRWPEHVQVLHCAATAAGKVELSGLMAELAVRGVNSVWVEAGATLAGVLLQQQLVDRLVVYVAPKLMGSHARGLLQLPCFSSMEQLPQLQLTDLRQLGDDLKLTYQFSTT